MIFGFLMNVTKIWFRILMKIIFNTLFGQNRQNAASFLFSLAPYLRDTWIYTLLKLSRNVDWVFPEFSLNFHWIFIGNKLVQWLKRTLYMEDPAAIQYGQTGLMNRGVFRSLSSKHQSFHNRADIYYVFKVSFLRIFSEFSANFLWDFEIDAWQLSDPKNMVLNNIKFHLEEVVDPLQLSQDIATRVIFHIFMSFWHFCHHLVDVNVEMSVRKIPKFQNSKKFLIISLKSQRYFTQ